MPSLVTVFVDGFFDEPALLCRMFGLKVDQHEGVSAKNARISQVSINQSTNQPINQSIDQSINQQSVSQSVSQ